MIRMNENQALFTARQVIAVIIALILISAFLPSQADAARDEPVIEIGDSEWNDGSSVILDDPIYFMGDEDEEIPVITSAGKTNVKVNGVKSKNKLVKYTIPEMLLVLDPNFRDRVLNQLVFGLHAVDLDVCLARGSNHGHLHVFVSHEVDGIVQDDKGILIPLNILDLDEGFILCDSSL